MGCVRVAVLSSSAVFLKPLKSIISLTARLSPPLEALLRHNGLDESSGMALRVLAFHDMLWNYNTPALQGFGDRIIFKAIPLYLSFPRYTLSNIKGFGPLFYSLHLLGGQIGLSWANHRRDGLSFDWAATGHSSPDCVHIPQSRTGCSRPICSLLV